MKGFTMNDKQLEKKVRQDATNVVKDLNTLVEVGCLMGNLLKSARQLKASTPQKS